MTWLKVKGVESPELASEIEASVKRRIASGAFSIDNVKYIEKVDLSATSETLDVSDETLERLRKLCQLWDVDIKVFGISSHRPLIGPVIVAIKKALFPIMRAFMKEFIIQQRAFNAEVISYLAYMSQKK